MKYKLVTTSQAKAESNTVNDYLTVSADKLFADYDLLRDWLLRHEAKTGTRNLFDVEGRPYNHTLWQEKLRQLETIEDEGRKRGLAGFLAEKGLLELLNPPLEDAQGATPHPTTVSNTQGGNYAM